MDNNKALEILKALADGFSPTTGEKFPLASPYQHPDVVRALCHAVIVLEGKIRNERKRGQLPENAGQPWSSDEDQKLIQAFEAGQPMDELAKIHKRTRLSIESRLIKLGKITGIQNYSR
jgi:hypothetical protein